MINLKNVLIGLSAVLLSACTHYQILTSEQLSERGTKTYKGVSVEKSIEATLAALETLGYNITLKEVKAKMALIKTAPLDVMTSATGTASGTANHSVIAANVTRDGLSWALLIRPDGNDVRINARPKAYRNGAEMTGEGIFVAEVMDPRFRDLWNEIDSILNMKLQ